MLKRQNIKFNLSGKVSCLFLLLLTFLMINPTTTSVSALEDSAKTRRAAPTISTINISFTPTSGMASLTPISTGGAFAQYSIKANVSVENSGGYVVYLGSNNSALTGRNTDYTIPATSVEATYENLPLNSWGYSSSEDEDLNPVFHAVSANNRGDILGANDATRIEVDEKTFTLSFAAHIGNNVPADVYENEVTLSVVSNPLEAAGLSSISNMQEMTTEICENSKLGETKQLIDLRDNKSYWVAKLPDNGCWMTQNLDLDLGMTWPDASLSDYSAAVTTYKPVTTSTTATSATIDSSNTATRSWSLGDYIITKPATASDCGNPKNSFANCTAQFTVVGSRKASSDPDFYKNNNNKTFSSTEYDAHYLVGNHYQWNTATAGTGGTIKAGQASGSICPKGWKLPTSNSVTAGSFGYLINAGSIDTNVATLTEPPYSFVRSGYVSQNTSFLLYSAGTYGNYWSSTPSSTNTLAYNLAFGGTDSLDPSDSYNRNDGRNGGYSIRCIAR